ncbi:permease prefix domain 1-containing protein [Sphaerisporangium sp. NBC_01403]|uniref:permease prefix domain 1-containing protein n=1 Tax=Sphaerisporangium sp. NBC_01403 TaxID=2903599 RepID=UPI0032479203
MASAGVIDDYVTTLGRSLRGPRRVRRDLVAEARDGLADTAEAYLAQGMDQDEAERTAVAEFGTVTEVAPGYQEELTAHQGRRTAAVLFITVPLMTLMWSGIWRIFPEDASAASALKPAWFGPLARFLDLFQFGMGILGGLALVILAGRLRRVRRPDLVTRALGILLWIQVPAIVLISAALTAGGESGLAGFDDYFPGMVASVISYLIAGWLLCTATRCLIVSRATPLPARARETGILH